ncbi:hypothetical protein BDY24DRAFT_139309 [Mrakia frigida]|uniref:uncharacterized protein n=1 Tax=Mrakia frigida TaxID=29902 RepID=UPI003FCBF626
MLDAFGRLLTDHSDDEAGIVAVLRFLTGLVNQVSTESIVASFWIGVAILQISPLHFVVGLDLVAVSLRTLLSRGIYPTPTEFLEALIPNGNFFLSNVDADWDVSLEGSFAFSILILFFKGLHLPLARKAANDVLFQLFEILLRSEALSPAEELAFGHTLASVPSNLSRIDTLYHDLGRHSSWEDLPLTVSLFLYVSNLPPISLA